MQKKKKILSITITNLDEKHRNQLKGAIKFFSGDKNNIQIQIINGEEKKKKFAGGIYLTTAILKRITRHRWGSEYKCKKKIKHN